MPDTKKLRTWQVNLTTLSPLFIGSGKTLSPYSDFIQDGNMLIYLNQKKIEEVISDKPQLIDEYVKEIRKKMNNTTSEASLKDFITTRLKLSLESVTLRKVPIVGSIGRQQLRQFIATAGRPFIPGSSIKGAFRTAVLYDWLMNDKNGQAVLNEIARYITKSKSKEIKEQDEAKKEINRMQIEEKCFGSISQDPFRFLQISDSNCIELTRLQVCQVSRFSILNDKSQPIPQPEECLMSQTNATLKITIQKLEKDEKFQFLNDVDLTKLFKKVKDFSKEAVLRELDELENNKLHEKMFTFYEKLEKQIDQLKSNEVILRLGGGKTFFDNSIGLSIDNDDTGESLELFLIAINMPKYKGGIFPKTRTVVVSNNKPDQPMGWVKLSIIN